MRKIWTIAPVIAAALVATPAAAQATRTWVSGVGDDANPCSRTAPCKTFAGAISKTAAGGEINAIDPGGFGAVTITKSITIKAVGVEAGILVSSTNGIIINSTTARVVLDGLDFEGLAGAGVASTNGVNIVAAADVTIVNSNINGFSGSGAGSGTGAGVNVNVGTGKTLVTIDNVRFTNNAIGVLVQSPSGRSNVRVANSTFSGNSETGVRVTGTGNRVLITDNKLLDLSQGLSVQSGGTATTSGNNTIAAPASDAATLVPQG